MVESITAHDGRALEVFVDGPDDGTAVLMHHGTPSAGTPYPPRVQAATERGLRLVSWSRPGYGASDRREGRRVVDVVADVEAIADALGADRFYTVGGSGGGPHVLATAALLPGRVLAAASVAGVVPWGADGIDWLDGMGQDNVNEFGAALEGGQTLQTFLEPLRAEMLRATPAGIIEVMSTLLSDVDLAMVNAELGEFLAREVAHALQPGIWGWFDDDIAFTTPWGFGLESITAPVAIWHGQQDRFVPFAHGEWLAEHVEGATTHLFADEGHLSIFEAKFGQVLDEMAEAATDRVG
jgi:pimeloyl-ACP methyl ester carboxylesterase